MRDFFIRSMEWIVNVAMVLGAIAVVISSVVVMFGAGGGFFQGIGILLVGMLYLILMGGMVYLGLGIYNNTRRTADAVEALVRKQI